MAFVVDFLNSGGAERAALNMAEAAPRSECHIVAEWRGGDLYGSPETAAAVFASDVTSRSTRLKRIARLQKTLRNLRPDVVVSMLSPVVTTAAARTSGAAVMHWLQAPWSETTAISASDLTGHVQRQLLRAAVAESSIVAGATPGLCQECGQLGIAEHKLALLPNGLRLPEWSATRRHQNGAEATIITIGRLEEPKRHDLTIRAFARLLSVRPLRLIVVGSGRNEAELRALAAELGIAERVEFTGFVPDPHEPLRRADVFVLATEYEGFGNVIVEALSEGLPVVVSDVPYGPRFILEGGRHGTLVAADSVEDLTRALGAALETAPLPAERVEAARARAASFALDRVADRFEELVDIAASRRGSVPAAYRDWT